MTIYVASDHAGRETKEKAMDALEKLGFDYRDVSPENKEDDDYPDFAEKVCRHVQDDGRGFLSCGTGIGIGIAANKYDGIRAARVVDEEEARLARRHNDANILVIGDHSNIEKEEMKDIIETFYTTSFDGGRHARRVDKIGQ